MKQKDGKSIRTGKRIMAALLMLCLVLTVPGINGMAATIATVSGNDIESESLSGNGIEPESLSGNDIELESLFSDGIDGTDTTKWSYILFGSYPQSEITDKGMKNVIDNAIKAKGLTSNGEGIDVLVSGTKYRRISISDCNNPDYFDNPENNGYRYFKWEPIRWRVLQNDGTTLLAMADQAVDCKDYNDVNTEVAWDTCTLRNWLNDSFYRTAFSIKERTAIVPQTLANNGDSDNTTDNVWLLSVGEITDTTFGFCSEIDVKSVSRMVKTSDYAGARGVGMDDAGNCSWWLRTLGNKSCEASEIQGDGSASPSGNFVDKNDNGVVPVLHIDCFSGLWSVDTPSNPVHHHESGYDTTWSYVYFGSYPQSEVTDTDIKTAIDNAIAAGGLKSYGEGIDVWVEGTKYRRISESDCTADDNFGDENNGYRYFKWERIKWRVLQNDGSTLFVAADQAIDCKKYNDKYINVTWETCTLRSWLNNLFYRTAFDSAEREAIVGQTVVNNDNPDTSYGADGGNDTADNIYLLSFDEVTNVAFGFCSNENSLGSRRMKISDYANVRGVKKSTDERYEGYRCGWWLRTPARGVKGSDYAMYVSPSGSMDYFGWYVRRADRGVVPALHIDLDSGLWKTKDDGGSGSGGGNDEVSDIPSNPVHYHDASEYDNKDTTKWSYVYFGSYPQSEVSDEATKLAIDSAISQGKGLPAGRGENSEGTDVWVNETKYRRISKSDCNNDKNFGDENNGYRYFKWERIKWRVLNNDGSTLFVAADWAIDCKDYNGEQTDATWEDSALRGWMNDSFYQTAFDSGEQESIVGQPLVNGDNVYLLSYEEVTDSKFGFCGDAIGSDSRRLEASDYAHVRGVLRNKYIGYEGKCSWWLRTPGQIGYTGTPYDTILDKHDIGVVPALHMNLSSGLWYMTNDGTSGSGGEDSTEDGDSGDSGNNNQGGKISQITLTGISKKIAAGKKIKLTAEVLPGNAADKGVTWTSSNPKYATVDANGVVKIKKAGAKKTVTITATAKDGSGVCAQYKIRIMKHAVRKVKITAPEKSVKAGKKLKLKATVTTTGKNANKNLKWTSSNESYATVSSSGVVKATTAGKGKSVTITAMATDGSGKKAKIKIKIK